MVTTMLLLLMQKAKTSWIKQNDFLLIYFIISLTAVDNVNGKRFV